MNVFQFRARAVVAAIAALFASCPLLHAQTGADSFNPGASDLVRALARQSDGKILVGGSFTRIGGGATGTTTRNRIARLNADGTVDTSFNPGANNDVIAFAVQPDGKIVVGGLFTTIGGGATGTTTRNRIARLNSDGSLDASFNPGANGVVTVLALQADNKILVGGTFTTFGGGGTGTTTRRRICRLNVDGSVDVGFDPGADDEVDAIAVQTDGAILLGGYFTGLGGGTGTTPRSSLGRVSATGTVDPSFDPHPNSLVWTIALQPDGRIIVGGGFSRFGNLVTGFSRRAIARLSVSGAVDATFNPGTTPSDLSALAIQPDGRIVLAGSFTGVGGGTGTTARTNIARVSSDGSVDTSFDAGADSYVTRLLLQPDGNIVVAGNFRFLGGGGTGTMARNYIGRLNTGTASPNPLPAITSILPSAGPADGGTAFTITGTGFQTGATVVIGGAAATSVSVGGPTTITGVTPPHAAGVQDLVVTNPDLQSATKSGAFTYTTTAAGLPVITAQPTSVTVAAGGSAQFAITANGTPAPTYQWQVSTTSGTTWTNLTDAAPYSGASTPILSLTNVSASLTGSQYRAVAANSAGTATSTAATLTVTAAPGCSYTLGASTASFASVGGTGSVAVTASPSNCAWTAVSNDSFITVTSGASGAGNGTVAYSVGFNYVTERFGSSPRSGTLSIAGQTFTVSQAGNQVCVFSLATSGVSMTASGGAGSVGVISNVTNSSGCSWTATSNASWLTITGGATSEAGGPVTFVAAPNHGLATRTGTLSIKSSTFTVTQAGTGPLLSADRTALTFAATTNGTSFTTNTSAQTVRLTQNSTEPLSWSAAPTVPWLTVSPASGTGSAILTMGVRFDSSLPSAGTVTGSLVISLAGVSGTVGPVSVSLNLASPGASAAPFGVLDTPVGDATVLAGSVAVTGWTLDDVGVQRVELWRDLLAGETTPSLASTPSDPRNGKVFIGNPTFVDGARQDVEALHPTVPFKYRAGWGYLLLTRGLWNEGNGTYRLYAFAVDQEGNIAAIGTKTIVVSNSTATKPFGSIDTPEIGGNASGPNFGWALTPKVNGVATCKIQPSGVQYSIDSGPLQPVIYGGARTDIAGAFPGFSNSAAAGGHAIIDWNALTNGPHTIGWLITDDCNRADGVGSRFFNVTTGTSAVTASDFPLKPQTSPDASFRLQAETAGIEEASRGPLPSSVASDLRRNGPPEAADGAALVLTRGYNGGAEVLAPDDSGTHTIEVKQGQRIELRLPRGYESAVQVVGDQARGLPIGSTWDAASGTFYWQPAPAFLGAYHLTFNNGLQRIPVRVVVTP